jgi:hypothetical protein
LQEYAHRDSATYTADLSAGGTSSTFTVNYPASPWTLLPIVVYSVTALTFSGGLKYALTLSSINTTALTANLAHNSTVSKLTLMFLIMDSSLYSATLTSFSYTKPPGASGVQSVPITGMQNHDASFMVAMDLALSTFPGSSPLAESQVVSIGDISKTNLTITFDTQKLLVNYLQVMFIDFDLSTFKALPYDSSGQKWTIYGTSGIVTNPYSANSYLSTYRNNYILGLLTVYEAQFLTPPLSFDATTAITSKVYYFTSELIIAGYRCPSQFPIVDHVREYCYSGCAENEYYDDQYMCQPCDPNCLTCYLSATNCTSCLSPWVLKYGFVCGCPSDSY